MAPRLHSSVINRSYILAVGSQRAPGLDIQTAPSFWTFHCPQPSMKQTSATHGKWHKMVSNDRVENWLYQKVALRLYAYVIWRNGVSEDICTKASFRSRREWDCRVQRRWHAGSYRLNFPWNTVYTFAPCWRFLFLLLMVCSPEHTVNKKWVNTDQMNNRNN